MVTPEHPPKDKTKQSISSMPIMRSGYGLVMQSVTDDPNLSVEAKAIYAYLAAHANKENSVAYPTVKSITDDLVIGTTRYYAHFHLLTDKKIIIVEQHKNKSQYDNNKYYMASNADASKENAHGYGFISKGVMRRRDLSVKAKGVYAYICAHAGAQFEVDLSETRMQKHLNMRSESFRKAREELLELGVIERDELRNKDGKFTGCHYSVRTDISPCQREQEDREAENREAENREAENREAENREAENREAENRETVNQEAENRATENQETINNYTNNNILNTKVNHHNHSINSEKGGEMESDDEDYILDEILSTGAISDWMLNDDMIRLRTARALSGWDTLSSPAAWGMGDAAKAKHEAYKLYVNALSELLNPEREKSTLCGATVSYSKRLEVINQQIKCDDDKPYLPHEAAVDNFAEAMATKEIIAKVPYMQSCIWQELLKGDIERYAYIAC